MEESTTIANYKYYMQNKTQWKVTFKTKEVELKVKKVSEKYPGILNSLEKLKGNIIRKKFGDDFYFINNGKYRLIYIVMKPLLTIQIIGVVYKSFLYKFKKNILV